MTRVQPDEVLESEHSIRVLRPSESDDGNPDERSSANLKEPTRIKMFHQKAHAIVVESTISIHKSQRPKVYSTVRFIAPSISTSRSSAFPVQNGSMIEQCSITKHFMAHFGHQSPVLIWGKIKILKNNSQASLFGIQIFPFYGLDGRLPL